LTASWPGDTALSLNWRVLPGEGVYSLSSLSMSPHLGTHLDAPLHIDPDGRDVAALPLSTFFGPCEVVSLPGHNRVISPMDLPRNWLPAAPRVLFATGSWPLGAVIPTQFASLATELVEILAYGGVEMIGIDTPSVDTADSEDLPTHRACTSQGILIVEGLALDHVEPGVYTLCVAPLRLVGAEASPVRAFLLAETQPRT
jgi:arylformamidase